MRICHIITALEVGGAETMLVNFCNIHSRTHTIAVVYFKNDPKLIQLFDPKIQLIHIPVGLVSVYKLNAFLRSWKPDIVHTHLFQADLIGQLSSIFVPAKKICTMHNIHFKYDFRDTILFFLYSILFKTISRNTTVISISKVVQQHVESKLGVKKSNSKLVYNGVLPINSILDNQSARETLTISGDSFVILFIGRLEKQKSVHTLLQAIPALKRSIPNLRIEIVGDGSLRQELQDESHQLNLEKEVVFRGVTANPAVYYHAADIFVLPSIFEGLGNVLLEAFSAGLPVVASNIEGPKELIEHGENGLLFECQNHQELSSQILDLYTNPNKRAVMGEQAKNTFGERFSIKQYSDRLLEIYQESN